MNSAQAPSLALKSPQGKNILFIHSFNKDVLVSWYMSGTVLRTGDKVVNKKDEIPTIQYSGREDREKGNK
jgi:hypothetical protein